MTCSSPSQFLLSLPLKQRAIERFTMISREDHVPFSASDSLTPLASGTLRKTLTVREQSERFAAGVG